MKLNKKYGKVEKSEELREKKFQIAATAHAFEILSSRLYTDTTLAIVRELSTNAADAHIQNGNPNEPFDVHLPTYNEPYFEIRDYGTGLSHDDVMEIYTTYFNSTRNDSDSYTGALGLGSKSPFAYTDVFTVTSYHRGTARSYSAYRSEEGEPCISLLTEAATQERNGIKIHIDIDSKDHIDFINKARAVYKYFRVRPNITGETIIFDSEQPILHGDNWAIYDEFGSEIRVVMGNVCYHASSDKFSTGLSTYGALVVDVPIGACSVAANREELHYDRSTIDNIQAVIAAAMIEAAKQVDEKLDKSPNLLQKIRDGKQFKRILEMRGLPNSIDTEEKGKYSAHKLRVSKNKLFMRKDSYANELYPEHNTVYFFIENDVDEVKQKHKNAIRYWLNNQPNGRAYLFKIEDREEFEKTFGPVTIKLSELPSPPRKTSNSGTGGPRCSIKRLLNSIRKIDSWANVDEKDVDKAEGIAVRRKGYNVVINGMEYDPAFAIEIATSLGYKHVYGLPSGRYDKPRGELGLRDLEIEARRILREFANNGRDSEIASITHNAASYMYQFESGFLEAIDNHGSVCNDLVDFMTNRKPTVWKRLLSMFKIELREVKNPVEVFYEKYPLLRTTPEEEVTDSDIQEYIQWKNQSS